MPYNGTTIARVITFINDLVVKNKDLLTELDGAIGDGDLGLTMTRAFKAAAEEAHRVAGEDPGVVLTKVGLAIARTAPSTMGTLVATGFMRGGKAVTGKSTLTAEDFTMFFEAFLAGIQERGKANVGDKTILDVLKPASDALNAAKDQGLKEGLARMERAAAQGLQAATSLMSQHGKAAVFREKTVGVQDPGGTVGYLIIKAFHDVVSEID